MDAEQILKLFGRRLGNNKKLLEIARKASTYADAQKYAQEAADTLYQVLEEYVEMGTISQDELLAIFSPAMKQSHDSVARICEKIQRQMNEAAELGVGVMSPEFDAEGIAETVATIAGAEGLTASYIQGLISSRLMKVVDRSIESNAEAYSNLGLKTMITRTYDGVGLHDGKEPCKWCLERCGTWTDYDEAKEAGAFERHDGCGCVIEYKVGKTHTLSNQKSRWRNI